VSAASLLPIAAELVEPVGELVGAIVKAVLAKKTPEEVAAIALAEATKIQNIQRAFDARALGKFKGIDP
jgi:hypothetical protein